MPKNTKQLIAKDKYSISITGGIFTDEIIAPVNGENESINVLLSALINLLIANDSINKEELKEHMDAINTLNTLIKDTNK